MSSNISIQNFSPQLFWDVDRSKMDMNKNVSLIVERVLQRGNRKEFDLMLSYYGKDKVRQVIKNLSWLNEKDAAFAHVFFNIPFSEMKCFIKRQYNRNF